MGIVQHRDRDRLRRLARREVQRAARRGVVRPRLCGAVPGRVVHLHVGRGRPVERHREGERRSRSFEDIRIRNRQPGRAFDPGADRRRQLAAVRRAGHARRAARSRGAQRDRDRSVARGAYVDPVRVELGLVDARAPLCDSAGDGQRVAHRLVLVHRFGAVEDLVAEHQPEPELARAVVFGGHVDELRGERCGPLIVGSRRPGACTGLCRHRAEQRCRQHPAVRRAQRPRRPALAVRREHDADVPGPVGRHRDLPQVAPPVDPAHARHAAAGHLERAVAHVGVAVRDVRAQAQAEGERRRAVMGLRKVFEARGQRRRLFLLHRVVRIPQAGALQVHVLTVAAVFKPDARVVAVVQQRRRLRTSPVVRHIGEPVGPWSAQRTSSSQIRTRSSGSSGLSGRTGKRLGREIILPPVYSKFTSIPNFSQAKCAATLGTLASVVSSGSRSSLGLSKALVEAVVAHRAPSAPVPHLQPALVD